MTARFKMLVISALLLAAALVPYAPARAAELQGLDPGFGDGGRFYVGIRGQARAVAVQPDGKIVLAGYNRVGERYRLALARVLPNGSLDAGFGDNGRVVTDLVDVIEWYADMAGLSTPLLLQDDGKIISGGRSPRDGISNFALIRFHADGSIDDSFGSGGVAVAAFDGPPRAWALDVAAQADGKLIASGGSYRGHLALARFTADGQLDAGFGDGGTVATAFDNPNPLNGSWTDSYTNRVTIQPDGKIVAAGALKYSTGRINPYYLAMARYEPDGKLDTSFGTGGKVLAPYPSGLAMAVQPDGKIAVGGAVIIGSTFSPSVGFDRSMLRRYNADGTRDTSLDRTAPFGAIRDLVAQPDGKVVVTPGNFIAIRYNPDGSRDTSFGPAGQAPGGGFSDSFALALQPDGKILLAGTDFMVARYEANTPCEPPFTDLPAEAYYTRAVRELYCRGAVSGYGDNTFRPFEPITRAQVVKMILLATERNLDYWDAVYFADVPRTDPFFTFVTTAHRAEIVSGYSDLTFHPYESINRGQLSKIIVKAMGWPLDTAGGPHFGDVPADNPFYPYVETAYNRGIVSGYADGTFRWQAGATRGQASKIIHLAIEAGAPRK